MLWIRSSMPVRLVVAGSSLLIAILGAGLLWVRSNPRAEVVVGSVPLEAQTIAYVVDDVPEHRPPPPPPKSAGEGRPPTFRAPSARGLWPPNGNPPGPAKRFLDQVERPAEVQYMLIIGTDARSGNPADGTRADSIHILALHPQAGRGTILGIPRDSYVNIPGYGKRKINDAFSLGGPDLMVRTVRELTHMPISWYMVTAFQGFERIVDALGGIDVHVPYDMNDDPSGAYFRSGWHRMNGPRALAFTRNRHVPAGDFARQENQGRLMMDVLKKLRAETRTRSDIERWLGFLVSHVRLDIGMSDLTRLGMLARVTPAASVRNVVAPGYAGWAGRASVVYLTQQAYELFEDVRQDGFAEGSYPAYGPAYDHSQGEETDGEPPPEDGGELPLP